MLAVRVMAAAVRGAALSISHTSLSLPLSLLCIFVCVCKFCCAWAVELVVFCACESAFGDAPGDASIRPVS